MRKSPPYKGLVSVAPESSNAMLMAVGAAGALALIVGSVVYLRRNGTI